MECSTPREILGVRAHSVQSVMHIADDGWSVGEGKRGAFEEGVALRSLCGADARRSIETIGCSSVSTEQAASNQLVLSAAHQSLRI